MVESGAHTAGQVWVVDLDPTVGSGIQKPRPCVIISPNEMNKYLRTVIVAPMTTAERNYPVRVKAMFGGKRGQVALDQIRSVDKSRLVQHLGELEKPVMQRVAATLVEMFAS